MMTRLIAIVSALVLSLSLSVSAQIGAQRAQDTALISVTATTITILDPIGSTSDTFEYIVTGAPATSTITLKGCMRGGTCVTLDVLSDVITNITRYTSGSDYDNFQITWAFTGGTAPTLRINWTGSAAAGAGATADPCASPGIAKSFAIQDAAAANTFNMVPTVANQIVYVCGFTITMVASAATTDTIFFKAGGGGSCGTGGASVTPTWNSGLLSAGATVLQSAGNMTQFRSKVGQGMCAVTTVGTTPNINIHLVYVQM